MYIRKLSAFILAPWLGVSVVLGANPVAPPLFRDPAAPLEARVDDLIKQLTVSEKISQMMMGSKAIPRLGIPEYHWWSEALHGVARFGTATVFPQAIGLAATWNPDLLEQVATAISTEARAKNNEYMRRNNGSTRQYKGITIWSPNINIFRDPRWGRGQETYGEDPYLTGRMAVGFIHGLQGNDPKYLKTVATVKHFAVHSGPESERHRFNAKIGPRDLWETYLPAFETGICEGGAVSLMSAYNAVNDVPASCNATLLTTILRDRWGFKGAVVGDVDSVSDIHKHHHYTKDGAESSALAVKAGNDLCSGETYENLPDALKRGLISEADLDKALARIFTLRFRLGQFDPPAVVPFANIPISENETPASDHLALEAARQSLVLLKNDGVLPWTMSDVKTVAVIGPTADLMSSLLGNYAGTPSHPSTLLKGLRDALEPKGITVLSAPGAPVAKGFQESGNPIPADVLFADETRATAGLVGQVFTNLELKGVALAKRTDGPVDLRWNPQEPQPNIPTENVAIRWTGILVPTQTGSTVLGMTLTGSGKLFIDDKMVIDAWKPGNFRCVSKAIVLEAGKPYRVRLDYAQTSGGAQIQLGWKQPNDHGILNTALAIARKADHIVLTLGLTPDIEGEQMNVSAEGFASGDRTSVLLPSSQRDLLDAISALGKPVTVVLTTGSAISLDTTKANAILVAWYYGQRGGDALAEALCGTMNPSGRLPVTFYQNDADLPDYSDYSMANRTYRYFTGKPLFAFGYGLSYTTFTYAGAKLSATSAKATDGVTVQVEVKNTGKRRGDEVVQVYAHAVAPPVAMPIQSLVGFSRVSLEPGESKMVEIPIKAASLRRWNEATGSYIVDPGAYTLRIGPSSDNAVATTTLTITPSVRLDRDLVDDWKFIREEAPITASPEAWTAVRLPHTWNNLDILPLPSAGKGATEPKPYHGPAWYALNLKLDPAWRGQRVFVRFEAASLVAKAYLNGTLLGEHRGGFTAFCFELTPHLDWSKARNELRVQVDNTKVMDVAPLSGDFHVQGGIYRPVHLIVTGKGCISPLDYGSSGVYVSQGTVSESSAEIRVRTVLSGVVAGMEADVLTELLDADYRVVASATSPQLGGASEHSATLSVPAPHHWQGLRDPYLYTCRVTLRAAGVAVDRVETPFGIRTVEITQEQGFLLNGKPYPVFGVNRHQDLQGKGWALSPVDHDRDLALIREMGATAIRLAHYPQSRYFHDICDRAGLLLWDEVPLVNETDPSPAFAANAELQMREMILQLYNHPSIAFWGLYNELLKNHERNAALIKQIKAMTVSLDTSRLIVGATCVKANPMHQVPDWNCWNIYPGWYKGKTGDLGMYLKGYAREIGKRAALSEYGCGGNPAQHQEDDAIPVTNTKAVFHPEEYQAYNHEKNWESIQGLTNYWGTFIWNMFDFTAPKRNEGGFTGLNDKGLITYDRALKKDAFYFYKANWNPEPMLHLCGQRFLRRATSNITIKAFANCGPVTLTVNGREVAKGNPGNVNTLRWEKVPLAVGVNDIVISAEANGRKLEDRARWIREPVSSTGERELVMTMKSTL